MAGVICVGLGGGLPLMRKFFALCRMNSGCTGYITDIPGGLEIRVRGGLQMSSPCNKDCD